MSASHTSAKQSARIQLLAGLPVTERQLPVAGVSTSILEGGDGPPLILLHGGIECGGVVWGPIVPLLARTRRLVIPDLPGLGESDPVTRLDAAFDSWFAELVQVSCQKSKATLVAHSLAGGMAARFALRHSDMLDHLVIYGAPAVGPYRVPAGLQFAAIRYTLWASDRNNSRLNRWFMLDLDRTRAKNPDWYDAFDAYCRERGAVRHVKQTMSHLIKTQAKQIPVSDLARMDLPTSLLWGRHDRVAPFAVGKWASDRLHWPLRVIDDAGHVPHIEQPPDFLRALDEFLPVAPDSESL